MAEENTRYKKTLVGGDVQLTAYIRMDQMQALDKINFETGATKSETVRNALDEYLEKHTTQAD